MTFELHKDIKVIHENTEAPKAYFIPYESEKNAKKGIREHSPYFKSLCGEWNFKFFASGAEIDEDMTDPELGECDCGCFETINVPMSWQMKLGKGYDVPNYTNINYPYPVDPPHIPDENPCAIYCRRFTVTEAMLERDVFINFEGVDSCFYLYINGEYVGYSTVSHCTSEFEVTKYLCEGENTVALLVFKWCSSSYLEDQDMWRLSGIFREVYLLSRAKNRIADIAIDTEVSDGYTKGKITADISYVGKKSAEYSLVSKSGVTVASGKCGEKLAIDVENCDLWSAETPNLYDLYITVADEVVLFRVGLREYKIQNGVMLVNGKAVKALGVNRHDSHPTLGHATPFEHMKNDLYIIKRHNANTVRTSHYPNDPRFTELCDRLGLYVVDEADLETHGMEALQAANVKTDARSFLSDHPDWRNAYVDRAARLYERDKNRACVIFWSLGNESGCGENHRAMRDYIMERNAKNIVHYQGASYQHWNGEYDDVSPIESTMYFSVSQIKDYMAKHSGKPYFLCEYCHAMGNGPGDLKAYVDYIRSEKRFFGGCVWEFTDHSVEIDVPKNEGVKGFTYGGDFGDTPHDGNFCVDGLVYPDRRAHTGLLEMKQAYKPYDIQLTDFENGEIKITSYRDFTTLGDLDLYWNVECNGREVASGRETNLRVAPGKSRKFRLFDALEFEEEGEYFLNVRTVTNGNTEWAAAGHEIAYDQFELFELCYDEQDERDERFDDRLSVACDERYVEVFANETGYLFDKQSGKIVTIIHNGTQMLASPIDFTVWRAPTDNDRYVKNDWIREGYDRTVTTLKNFEIAEESEDLVQIAADYTLGAKAKAKIADIKALYTFVSDGSCTVELGVKVRENTVFLPKFGLTFAMPEGNERMSYYGYGPYESYIDKNLSSHIGLFASSVTDNFEPYVKPQENSSHHACRRASVGTLGGNGLKFEHVYEGEYFSFNAQHYSTHDLTNTKHDYELEKRKETFVSVDFAMSGIGSNSCGPALAPQFRFNEKDFSCAVKITPSFFDED